MRPGDLVNLERKPPFSPFRIHVANGQRHGAHRPDALIGLRLQGGVGAGADDGLPHHVGRFALIHIDRLNESAAEEGDAA